MESKKAAWPKFGEWVYNAQGEPHCSECGAEVRDITPFCAQCGACMDDIEEIDEEESYMSRFSVVVKGGDFAPSRGYVVRATGPIDMLQKLSERVNLCNSATIAYSEILLDSDIID